MVSRVQLEDAQIELLKRFVAAHRAVPTEQRGDFVTSEQFGATQAEFIHYYDPDVRVQGSLADANVLADLGLLRRSSSRGTLLFYVLPAGPAFSDELELPPKSPEPTKEAPPRNASAKKRERAHGVWIRVGDCIGQGGNGQIYLAYRQSDTQRTSPYVIKILNNPQRVARFRKEIAAGLTLKHPNIVAVVDSDLGAVPPYLIAPYYRRKSLTIEHAKALSYVDRMRFFARVCAAVGHAHGRGIVHRDIKPANVLIADDGEPIVADFGLCHIADDEERPTESLEQVGSRFYMAPELADGRARTIRATADVYSLGKLGYWLYAGTVFDREKLRVGDFDLTKKEPRGVHGLLYGLLEKMVIESPDSRLPDAGAAAQEAESLAERMAMNAPVLDLTVPQACQYCHAGVYELRVDPRWWFPELHPHPEQRPGEFLSRADEACRRYGLTGRQGAPWMVLQCGFCGNVQVFQFFDGTQALKNWGLRK